MRLRPYLAAAFIALCFQVSGYDLATAQVLLTGGGSTFPAPLYAKWFDAYHKLDPTVEMKYQGVGSGMGQKLILHREVDFGASDAPMTNESLAGAPGKILHVPTVAGADVIIFNLHNLKELRLDGPTLAAIYLGKITHWNDPAITRQNPGTALPDMDITVVHRSDSSGTTYIFTDYLSSVSPEWKLKVGRYPAVNWRAGVGLQGSSGVSEYVKKTPGAIGYVELLFALQNQLTHASMRNSTGAYIKASTASITAALERAAVPNDFRVSLVNAAGKASYPIAGVTWLLVYSDPQDPVKAQKLKAFLKWAITEGQQLAPGMSYSPLPKGLRQRVLVEVSSISRDSGR